MSSISNPFFFDSAPPPPLMIGGSSPGGGAGRHRFAGGFFQSAAAGAPADEQQKEDEEDEVEVEVGSSELEGRRQRRRRKDGGGKGRGGGGQCCVANPFTEQGSGQLLQMERRMSQSMVSEPCSSSAASFTFQQQHNYYGHGQHQHQHQPNVPKLLQDSGYRSTTSNSALDEELAAVERQRRAEREQRRRQQQRRKQQPQQQSSFSSSTSSAVPAFLRRTCSSAASGILQSASSAIQKPGLLWMGGGGAGVLGTSLGGEVGGEAAAAAKKRGPRRTRSVGSHQSMAVAAGPLPAAFLYSTGWMVEAELSSDEAATANGKAAAEKEDCTIELDGGRRLGIQRLHELLLSRFCFISGLRTSAGHPVLTFPDSRCAGIGFEDYQLQLDYLMQTQREEEELPSCCSSSSSASDSNVPQSRQQQQQNRWIVVVDRRQDRWSSVRMVLAFLLSYFPEPIHLVFLLKPEGVLQRAIEYGYRGMVDSCEDKFKVLICQNCAELHEFVKPTALTMDVGGAVRHNHMEWVAHRIDIERMKSSARIIAESLGEFGRCLRETELPNDVQSTERVLELQQQERNAIKEDFRISIRKGMQLLRQVRQLEHSPLMSEQLSPSRLQNVSAIERMIAQLQDTEKSFDAFWQKHRQRLLGCLELRRFEDEFRKLQSCFAKHMLRLEEHREVGNSEASAERLGLEHEQYRQQAMEEVLAARRLRERGLVELGAKEMAELLNTQGSDSVGPKCEELARMAEALESGLERRARALELSRQMHAQIGKANDWCRRGVELLSIAPLDLLSAGCSNNLAIYEHALARLDDFLAEGDRLKMDALVKAQQQQQKGGGGADANGILLLTSTDTSSLLAQVSERIDDIRRLSRARQDALRKLSAERAAAAAQQQQQQLMGSERRKSRERRPVQVVSPEKVAQQQQQQRMKQSPAQHRQFSLDSASIQKQQQQQQKEATANNSNGCSPANSPRHTNAANNGTSNGGPMLVRAKSTTTPPACSCSPSSAASGPSPMEKSGTESSSKVNFVLDELLSTERNYVRELAEMLCHYMQPLEALELCGSPLLPPALRGQTDTLFGNLRDLHDFHHSLLLPALQQNANSVEGVSAVLSAQRQRLLALYRTYCRNKPLSEALRAEHGVDQHKFFMECQKRAGHLLPLSAYLLKPVQRITKYQLLLKELIRHVGPDADQSLPVQAALASMLDLLAQINADMEQLHILGYPGDIHLLGQLRLQTECHVFVYKRAKSASVGSGASGAASARRNGPKGKHQKRHLFLFDGGVLFCKKRVQAVQFASEYYEHKLCIPMHSLGFAECSRLQSEDRFELWDQRDSACFAVQPLDERARPKWVQRLARLTVLYQQQQKMAEAAAQGVADSQQLLILQQQLNSSSNGGGQLASPVGGGGTKTRPQSWTTTSSSEDGIGGGGSSSGGACGISSSSVHSSRSSTSSTNTFEEKCPPPVVMSQSVTQPPTTFRRRSDSSLVGGDHSIEEITQLNNNSSHSEEEADAGGSRKEPEAEQQQQQMRSQSQPPESVAVDRPTKKGRVDRL